MFFSGIPLTDLIPQHPCACLQRQYILCPGLFYIQRSEVIVRFVDICRFVYHHYLSLVSCMIGTNIVGRCLSSLLKLNFMYDRY